MDERRLYQIIDFILNHAQPHELDVIRAALRRREGGDPSDDGTGATFGQNIGKMAQDMASQVSEQIGASKEQIQNTVRGFVREMIEREAPELRSAQIEELLDQWVPGNGGAQKNQSAQPSPGGELPADVALTMVRHFVAFSTGAMTMAEEKNLSDAMPDWQKRYWQHFSQIIRKLISLYVKGVMSEKDFWDGVYDELGMDLNGRASQ